MKNSLNEVRKLQKIAGIIKESRFPDIGETISVDDLDYDTVDYFYRTHRRLIVTLKTGEKIESTVGKFDVGFSFFFSGKFPKHIQYNQYTLQIKYFDTIEIIG